MKIKFSNVIKQKASDTELVIEIIADYSDNQ